MKKIFAAAAIALFMMTSCSDEDSSSNNNNNTDTVLLKKMVETYEDGSTFTTNYTYNDNKLIKETFSDGSYNTYTYTDGRLTGIKFYDSDNFLTDEDAYTYNSNGKLATFLAYYYPLDEEDEGWVEKSVFTHNTNGTVAVQVFTGDFESQTELWQEGIITVTDGNVTSYVNDESTIEYLYDTKNNPMKNVVGNDITALAYQDGGINNMLDYSKTIIDEEHVSRTYVYNSDNYPVSAVETNHTNGADDETNIEYFYE